MGERIGAVSAIYVTAPRAATTGVQIEVTRINARSSDATNRQWRCRRPGLVTPLLIGVDDVLADRLAGARPGMTVSYSNR